MLIFWIEGSSPRVVLVAARTCDLHVRARERHAANQEMPDALGVRLLGACGTRPRPDGGDGGGGRHTCVQLSKNKVQPTNRTPEQDGSRSPSREPTRRQHARPHYRIGNPRSSGALKTPVSTMNHGLGERERSDLRIWSPLSRRKLCEIFPKASID